MSVLLDVQKLGVTYGGVRAVDGISIAVQADRVMGLIGPNGAGKTSAIDAISGYVPRAEGTIALAGQPLETLPAHRRTRAGLARTFQSIELFDDLTVRENLLVAAVERRWFSPLVDMLSPHRTERTVDIESTLELVGLAGASGASPTALSQGQRRLVSVARALVAQPKLVLLDEPAAGLDPEETRRLAEVIRGLPARGVGVLLVEHDMTLVLDVCDDLTVLDFGRVIASGEPAEVCRDALVVEAYLGRRP